MVNKIFLLNDNSLHIYSILEDSAPMPWLLIYVFYIPSNKVGVSAFIVWQQKYIHYLYFRNPKEIYYLNLSNWSLSYWGDINMLKFLENLQDAREATWRMIR